MITRCNRCGAKFEISADLVRSPDPTVRCGECLSVFDASEHLIPDDSIHNYVTDPASGRRRTDRRKSTPETAGVAASTTAATASYSGNAITAESMAGISADDLENASTLAFDHGATDDDSHRADNAGQSVDRRINDGFYSPDLDINQFDSSPASQFNSAHQHQTADRQVGMRDSTGESLDSTSLEFERTLALEKYTDADPADLNAGAAKPVTDYSRSSDGPAFNQPVVNDFSAEHRTNITYDETVRLEQTGDLSAEVFTESPRRIPDNSAQRNPEQSTSEYTDTAFASGRDYPLLSDDILDRNATVDETHDAFSASMQDQTQDQLESLYSDDRLFQHTETDRQHPQREDDFEEIASTGSHDQDSARELRRYVSSRGGAVYSERSRANNRQASRSSIWPVLLMCAALAGVLYLARNVIATMNLPEPVVSVFCAVTGCELPARKDVEQLELVRHQMFSHKTLDDVLVFSVDLVNRARFPQPYPVLVVTMANGTGESVAFRKFEPAEYLEDDPSLKTLPAGKPVRIKFEIVDPGPEALSSELSFE